MEFNKQDTTLLSSLKDKSPDAAKLRDAGSLYWTSLTKGIGDYVRKKADVSSFLAAERDFIDFGLTPEALEHPSEARKKILDYTGKTGFLYVLCFSDWISQLCAKIVQGDKKELLEKEIIFSRMQMQRLEKEIVELQQQRKESIANEQVKSSATRQQTDLKTGLDTLEQLDTLVRQNLKFKKAVSKGTFFSVTDKRKHCERENILAALRSKADGFLEAYQPKERAAIKAISAQVADDMCRIIDFEDAIGKMQKEIEELVKKKETISPLETEARIINEIDYLRDLVKLTAKRLHMESCPIVRPEDKYFTMKELYACLDRILEFDPRIFHNDRVAIFGRPSVLLIPGNGNSLYDWKNNVIIVPTLPIGGNFMASIATGLIEYRLDTDEDKRLLTSYNQLPQYEGVKSVFHLRTELTKDYIIWMVSEFKGYKNLAKEVRKWFEHEIAPSKNDIYIPPMFQSFVLPAEEFSKQLNDCESRLPKDLASASQDDLWTAGILNYQRGKFERSVELLRALVAQNPHHEKGLYNLGFTCMKLMYKQEAVKSFAAYTKLHPQSWWSGVVMDYVRRLQTG
jgi:tetratricopeptide (TPR) repeat protein